MFNGCRLFGDDLEASAKDSKICAEAGRNAWIRVKKILRTRLFKHGIIYANRLPIRAPHSTDLQVLKLDSVDTPRVELIFK